MSDENEDNHAIRTMNLPINEHFYKLECMIEDLINEVEESDKQIQMLKGEFSCLGYENNSQNGDDEVICLGKENLKQIQQNEDEASEIKLIIKRVKELKNTLNQQSIIIQHRIQEVESNIGFNDFFDPNLPSDVHDNRKQNDQQQSHLNEENNLYNQDSEEYQDNYDQEY